MGQAMTAVEPSAAMQKMIRARLIASADVLALVPADKIFDRNGRPEAPVCITIGEGVADFADRFDTFYDRPSLDLHIWAKENSFANVKEITGAVRAALRDGPWVI